MKNFFSPSVLKWIFISVISILWLSIFWNAYGFRGIEGFNWGIIVHETGELGWELLIFTIFISLFQKTSKIHFPKITIFSRLLPLRKYSGIFAFLIIATHALAEFAKQGIGFFDLTEIFDASFTTHHAAIFGTISFLIMLPLFVTSTDWAVKKMGTKAWKNLQRFTHVAFVFAALHIILLDYFGRKESIEFGPIILLTIYFVGYGYLFWRRKNK